MPNSTPDTLQDQLDQWRGEVETLRQKALHAANNSGWKLEKEAADLQWRIGQAQDKLDTIKTYGKQAFVSHQAGLDRDWSSLSITMKSAARRFN